MAIPFNRFKGEFTDDHNDDWTIYLRDESLSGDLNRGPILQASGFNVEWNAVNQDIKGGNMPSKCTVSILVHQFDIASVWDVIIASNEGDLWIDIRDKNGAYYWVGEILIEQCSKSDAGKFVAGLDTLPFEITLVASDRIAIARDIPCDFVPGGANNYSFKTHFEAIIPEFLNNLSFWPSGEPIVNFSHYWRTTEISSGTIPTYWEQKVGMDDNIFGMPNLFDQLHEMAVAFNARFVYADHQFWFFPMLPFPGETAGDYFTNFYEYNAAGFGILNSMFLYILTPSGQYYNRTRTLAYRNPNGSLASPFNLGAPVINLIAPVKKVTATGASVGVRTTTNSITSSKTIDVGSFDHMEQPEMRSKNSQSQANWVSSSSANWRTTNSGTSYFFLQLTTKVIADHHSQTRREINFTSLTTGEQGGIKPHYVIKYDDVYYLPVRVNYEANSGISKVRAIEIQS